MYLFVIAGMSLCGVFTLGRCELAGEVGLAETSSTLMRRCIMEIPQHVYQRQTVVILSMLLVRHFGSISPSSHTSRRYIYINFGSLFT